jgi:hypothetical protein
MKDLDNLLETLDEEPLTQEEIQQLKQQAEDDFNDLEGIEFNNQDNMTDKEILNDDFKVVKKVLQKNINRVEKLTNLLQRNLMMQPENPMIIGNLISVISEQNKQLKMVVEIQNKHISNRQLETKLNGESDKKKNTKLETFKLK